MFTFIIVGAGVILLGALCISNFPALGGKATAEQMASLKRSGNYSKKKFVNLIPTPMDMDVKTTITVLKEFIQGSPGRKPSRHIPVKPMNPLQIPDSGSAKITWFGHSAFLLELSGKTLLLDPMFGKAPSPFPWFGNKRYSGKLPMEIEQMPPIDAVFISHDHYDHLDYGSIKKLKGKVQQFFVPLGVGNHLVKWGIDRARIKELDWWSEVHYGDFTLACTPARHFSGRKLVDRDATLWCSWVIKSPDISIYYNGDSGYGPHFTEIGNKYGPFDLTLMECGQYDERWSAIHMLPEETVQAHMDLKGKVMIPIHWGAFTLSLHDWTDPIERALKSANERKVAIATPQIGETVYIGSADFPSSTWWRTI